ncbi:MAG TPA: hypothetical protein VMZ50_10020 [Phycisphaerae bacterium]|nr:hypothetical protein [Phycisphaerae bacterium]
MEHRDGVKTSEFWTALMTIVAGLVPGIVAILSGYPWAGSILAGIALIGPVFYIAGRAWLKAEETKTVDLLSDTWEQRLAKLFDVVEQLVAAAKQNDAGKDKDANAG